MATLDIAERLGGLAPVATTRAQERALPPTDEGFERIVLARHGLRPLAFEGRLLASVANPDEAMPVLSEVAVFEHRDGGLVASVRHRLASIGGPDLCFAERCDDPAELLEFLRGHDPRAEIPLPAFGWGDEADPVHWTIAIVRFDTVWRDLLDALLGRPADRATKTTDGPARASPEGAAGAARAVNRRKGLPR